MLLSEQKDKWGHRLYLEPGGERQADPRGHGAWTASLSEAILGSFKNCFFPGLFLLRLLGAELTSNSPAETSSAFLWGP